MRGSKAKKLRRAATNQTVGMPTVSYKINNHSRQARTRDGGSVAVQSTSVSMATGCTRTLYKILKGAA